MVVCVVGREHASIHPSICWDISIHMLGYSHVHRRLPDDAFCYPRVSNDGYPHVSIFTYPVAQISSCSDIQVSSHSDVQISGYPVIKISNHPDIRMSRYPVIQISSRPDIQLSTYPGDIAEMEVVDAHWRSQKWKLWTLWAAKMEVVAVTTTIFAKIEGMASILSLPNYPMRILCCFFLGVVELYISTPGGLSVFLAAFFFRGCHLFVGV